MLHFYDCKSSPTAFLSGLKLRGEKRCLRGENSRYQQEKKTLSKEKLLVQWFMGLLGVVFFFKLRKPREANDTLAQNDS